MVDKRCNYFGLRVYTTLRSIRPRFVLFCLFVCFYSFTVHLSDSQPNSFLSSSKLYSKRVSMGLTDRRKTAKNLVDSRKN